MMPFEFDCAGEKLQALPAAPCTGRPGGCWRWPTCLEKGSSYAVNARKLLPRHDTRQTLAMLTALIDVLQPETVVCLGDSLATARRAALADIDRHMLDGLTKRAFRVDRRQP